jgi:hypothetical protein
LNALISLAQHGASTNGVPFFMPYQMAQNLNIIVGYLQAAGISLTADPLVTSPSAKLTAMTSIQNDWKAIQGFGAGDALAQVLQVNTNSQTLQSLIELEYVAQGNTMIADNLTTLANALSTLQGVLNQLGGAQIISDSISASVPSGFVFPPHNDGQIPSAAIRVLSQITGIGTTYLGNAVYQNLSLIADIAATTGLPSPNLGSAVFSNDLKLPGETIPFNDTKLFYLLPTVPLPTGLSSQTRFASAITAYISSDPTNNFSKIYKIVASAYFSRVIPVPHGTSTQARALLQTASALTNYIASIELQNQQAGISVTRNTVNSLPYFLNIVVQDINTARQQNPNDLVAFVNKWILDNQNQPLTTNTSTPSGMIQNNLTQAIQSAQNLNTTQQQQVSQAMFIFQEFYKSASSVLDKITQIVEGMAQTISH